MIGGEIAVSNFFKLALTVHPVASETRMIQASQLLTKIASILN